MPLRRSSPFWGGFFDVPRMQQRIASLEEEFASPDFWTASDKKDPVIQELKSLRGQLAPYLELKIHSEEIEGLLGITEETDAHSLKHLEQEINGLALNVDKLEDRKSVV